MAKFTVRVELHDAKWEDYDTLHDAMASRGFSRQITASDGKVYQMPWAEYNAETNQTYSAVLNIAVSAAQTTKREHAILVTESNGRTWYGLSEV